MNYNGPTRRAPAIQTFGVDIRNFAMRENTGGIDAALKQTSLERGRTILPPLLAPTPRRLVDFDLVPQASIRHRRHDETDFGKRPRPRSISGRSPEMSTDRVRPESRSPFAKFAPLRVVNAGSFFRPSPISAIATQPEAAPARAAPRRAVQRDPPTPAPPSWSGTP